MDLIYKQVDWFYKQVDLERLLSYHQISFAIIFQKVGVVADLLASMKLLYLSLWPDETKAIDELRLQVALSMLKSPHFNAKMNALKEVCIYK